MKSEAIQAVKEKAEGEIFQILRNLSAAVGACPLAVDIETVTYQFIENVYPSRVVSRVVIQMELPKGSSATHDGA